MEHIRHGAAPFMCETISTEPSGVPNLGVPGRFAIPLNRNAPAVAHNSAVVRQAVFMRGVQEGARVLLRGADKTNRENRATSVATEERLIVSRTHHAETVVEGFGRKPVIQWAISGDGRADVVSNCASRQRKIDREMPIIARQVSHGVGLHA